MGVHALEQRSTDLAGRTGPRQEAPQPNSLGNDVPASKVLLTPAEVLRLQRLAGNASVAAMLTKERTAQTNMVYTQRMAMLAPTAGTPPHEMTAAERRDFVHRSFPRRDRPLAAEILGDIAAAGDSFVYTGESELHTEIVKRITMSRVMRRSQRPVHGMRAFGYPFTGESLYWGPRVNYAASAYWTPPPPDGYSLRTDRARRQQIRHLPRGERNTVYGDPAGLYEWRLTPAGAADPHEAIVRLFDPQPPYRRSLLHCDYLVSLVEYRAYAESVGKPGFNAAVAAFGPDNVVLRWNAFTELNLPIPATSGGPGTPGLGSLFEAHPSSEADLVIGDHVVFFNHRAYDALNQNIGNAWRLENAVVVDQRGRTWVFLGHGSGEKTAGELRGRLAQEYNQVVAMALAIVSQIRHSHGARRTHAECELATRFPNVKAVATATGRVTYRIQGPSIAGSVDEPLRPIRPNEVLGLRDPWDPTRLFTVRRPAEARP